MLVLRDFVKSHPGELILFDINHFYSMEDQDHVNLVDLVNVTIGEYLVPYHEYVDYERFVPKTLHNLTLESLGPTQRVIMFYHDDFGVNQSGHIFWPSSTIDDIWPQTDKPIDMIEAMDKTYEQRGATREEFNITEAPLHFYVYQGILTADGDTITANVLGSIYKNFVTSATSSTVNWLLAKRNNEEGLFNIVIADGVEAFNFLPTVVAMNIF